MKSRTAEEIAAQDTGEDAQAVARAFRRVFPGVMVAMFLAAADQTILASALPTIASSLGGLADVSWVVVGYLLAATVAAPLYGHLGDKLGRRRMLMGALAVFTLASVACAIAPNLPLLVAARAVQGLGGGGLMTLAQALIGESVPPRQRGRFAAYFATVFALASTSGPILGAYLTEHISWRAVFAVNIPLGILAAFLALRIPQAALDRRTPFRPDFVGAAIFAASTVAFLFAVSSGGNRFAWLSFESVGLLGGAIAGVVALVAWERRHADPVIPVRLLRSPAILRSDLVVLCFAAALFSTILYLPLYLQLGRGLGIGESGLLLLPITLSMVISSSVVGRLIARTGHVTGFPPFGLVLATASLWVLAATLDRAPTPLVLAATMLVGVGLGMVMPPTQVSVQQAAGRDALGAATASISLARAFGGAIGVALTGAIVFALIGHSGALSGELRAVIEGGPAAVSRLSEADRLSLATTLDHTFRIVFACIGVITAVGAAIARTVPKPSF